MTNSEQEDNLAPTGKVIAGAFAGYDEFLRDLKSRIQSAQIRAALAVNRELVELYWHIGRDSRPPIGAGLGREGD